MERGGGQDKIGKLMFDTKLMSSMRVRNTRKQNEKRGKNINRSNPIYSGVSSDRM